MAGLLSVKVLENMLMPILQNCKTMNKLKNIHAQIVKFSLSDNSNYLVTKMVNICDQHQQIDYATLLFRQVSHPNIYLYNAIIRACYTHSHLLLVVNTYKQMLTQPIFPDHFTFPFVLRSCGLLTCLDLGKQVHGHVMRSGVDLNKVVQNSVLDMYIKCDDGGISDARKVFDEMSERDVISWNSLICGHIKVGRMRRARELFDEMPEKSIVSWTAMITGYARNGSNADALHMFHMMQLANVKPDWISLLSVLPVCTQLGALELGKWIHFYAEKNGLLQKTSVCNALVEMYAKSGKIDQAWQVFDKMPQRDVISWSTMIGGLANHGKAHEAIGLFQEMQKTTIKPNEITFVGLLSACAHSGLLKDGLKYFDLMRNDYNIDPGIEHYGCLVDLLGKTGCLDRAFELIKTMPMKPDAAIWGSLLSSCRTKGNLEMAVIAMEHLLELEPEDTGNYVLLSNIYADLGRWDGVSRMRKLMRGKIMSKTPGCSSIEIDNVVQEFVSGDDSKPFSRQVYQMLDLLALHHRKSVEFMGEIVI
ncbi:pentatricopeptide repeat-containing protein At2g20540 [Rutidosis leptorrhynchoides]|uniref:pentatricopeptide repeat-containing protein At2g20540 n=1 Tax=Rutidosis leptorrhynchoides TaxID=125765 RepID=UPI003A99E738